MKHTRIIILLLVLTATFASLNAQTRLRQPEMYFGAHGGVIASITMFTPEVPGTRELLKTALLGGNAGLMFRYCSNRYFGLQVELNWMQRGWRENTNDDSLNVHYTRRLDYLELPFLTHFYFGKKNWKGFINLGPQVGVCIHEYMSGSEHQDPDHRTQYSTLDNIVDWGLAVGVGFYCNSKKAGVFQFEARFDYSFGNYFNDSKRDYFQTSNPLSLSLNVGYLWDVTPRKKMNKTKIQK
ncbi:MAG: PorT family protein [Paludibacteraceae bacterium]|nr:PorT family protein [Paludibacteraceae bacterium]